MTIIPGWNPSPFKGDISAVTLTSITMPLSSSSVAATVDFPVGIIAGDLIVLLDRATQLGGIPTDVTPSGFTRIGSSQSGTDGFGARQNAWYKLAAGTETGALTGMNGNFGNAKAMAVFRGNIAATALTVAGVGGQMSTGNPTAQNCTAGSGTPPLVVLGFYGSTAAIAPRTFSTTAGGEVSPGTTLFLAWKIYNSSPANTSIDMDDEGTLNILQSAYIQMA